MSVTFDRATPVEAGQRLSSKQLGALASAFNTRLRSGLGDGDWRIAFWNHALVRQIRNSDGAFTFPSQAEFFIYQGVEPNQGQWPLTGPGDPEGTNVNSILGAYVFGNEAMGAYSESSRLGALPLDLGGIPPQTPRDVWALGKYQRGAIDLTTGNYGCPAFDAARSYAQIRTSKFSPHGNSYGGWQPMPELMPSTCEDPISTDEYAAPVNYEIKFTATASGYTDKTYDGTCQPGPDISTPGMYDTHVAGIANTEFAWYVFLWNGSVDVLSKEHYVEGPYIGEPKLTKAWGDHLPRVFHQFASDYRGWEQNDGDYKRNNRDAFDFQRFFSQQYLLAPVVGRTVGESIEADYPEFRWSGNNHLGQFATAAGAVCSAFYVESDRLNYPITITAYIGTTAIGSATVSNDAPSKIHVFQTAKTGTIYFRSSTNPTFSGGTGELYVQALHQLEYKPRGFDALLVIRTLNAKATDGNSLDGSGRYYQLANELGDVYFENACVINQNGVGAVPESFAEINTNAVFDAARRMTMNTRLPPRQQLVGYAVEDGKSVLWFRRYYNLSGVRVDMFAGIADAINHDAVDTGWSNEWLLRIEPKPYHYSESSPFKPSAYSDYFTFINRAHFQSPTVAMDLPLLWHTSYGQRTTVPMAVLAPESPSGYNYAQRSSSGYVNTSAVPGFYKSCRIYEPPCEVQSAETVVESGEELVKITLTGRLHSTLGETGGADATVDRDLTTWDVAALKAEPFRTNENAVRLYLCKEFLGINTTDSERVPGDEASDSYGGFATYASIFPLVILTKLFPVPKLDDNEKFNPHDTPAWHDWFRQADIYLRAICEGYVDGTKSAESNCANGTTKLIDYTYENLCYQAFGQRSLTIKPLSLRSDAAAGFGPYPNTKCYADTYNQFVSAINLLTRVRVMLPWVLETNVQTIANSILLASTDSNGCSSAQDCTAGVGLMSWQGQPASATTVVSESGWGEFSSYAFAQTSAAITETCSDLSYILESYRVVTQWRFAHFDADQAYAIPELWRDMVSTNLGTLWTDEVIHTIEKPIAGAYDCNGTTFTCDWTTEETLHETSCIVSASGVADQGATPDYGWVWFASNTSFPPTVCNGGPSRVEYLVPVDPTQVFLQVPLTDWTGEE